MIRIINESNNEFNIENMVFEINLWLPIFHSNTNDADYKEPYFAESWKIDKNLIIPDRKMTNAEYNNLLKSAEKFIEDNVTNTTINIINKFNDVNIVDFSYIDGHRSNSNRISYDSQSFAYYMEIGCDTSTIDCTPKIETKLSKFMIRVANHISHSEFKTLDKKDNVKVYHNQMLDMYEEQFGIYVQNILNAYSNFIVELSNYSYPILAWEDIKTADIDMLKNVSVQGRFEEYEKRYGNSL